jgi:hypothetical protein
MYLRMEMLAAVADGRMWTLLMEKDEGRVPANWTRPFELPYVHDSFLPRPRLTILSRNPSMILFYPRKLG